MADIHSFTLGVLRDVARHLECRVSGAKAELILRLEQVLNEREITFTEVLTQMQAEGAHSGESAAQPGESAVRSEEGASWLNCLQPNTPEAQHAGGASEVPLEPSVTEANSNLLRLQEDGPRFVGGDLRRSRSVVSLGNSSIRSDQSSTSSTTMRLRAAARLAVSNAGLNEKKRRAEMRMEEERKEAEMRMEEERKEAEMKVDRARLEMERDRRQAEVRMRDEMLQLEIERQEATAEYNIFSELETNENRVTFSQPPTAISHHPSDALDADPEVRVRSLTRSVLPTGVMTVGETPGPATLQPRDGNERERYTDNFNRGGEMRGTSDFRRPLDRRHSSTGGQPAGHGMVDSVHGVEKSISAMREVVESTNRSRLPKRDIENFDGSLEYYTLFKTSFNSAIGCQKISVREKLHFLHQFTRGTPRDLVKSCLYMEGDQGYQLAWRLLDDRYGLTHLITNAHVDKVLQYPSINRDDPKSLDRFAIELVIAGTAVTGVAHGKAELENPKTLRQLVEKLPFSLQEKWRDVVLSTQKKLNRAVGYDDLVEFVNDRAKAANDPVYGKLVMGTTNTRQVKPRESRPPRVTVGSIREREQCIYCNREHTLDTCVKFAELDNMSKRNLIWSNKLCYSCLGVGHVSRECKNRLRCETCGGMHPNALHVDGRWRESESGGRRTGGTGGENRGHRKDVGGKKLGSNLNANAAPYHPVQSTSRDRDAGEGTSTGEPRVVVGLGSCTHSAQMSILPVDVISRDGRTATTFAILDSGSSVTLCSESLLDRLSIGKGELRRSNVTAVTLGGDYSLSSGFVEGLSARGRDEREEVPLPPAYVVKEIPMESEEVEKVGDVSRWEHLKHVGQTQAGKVEILIGANAPALSEPIEVIRAPNRGDPYAVHTRLGWIVCGLEIGCRKNVGVRRVATRDLELEELVQKAFDVDFKGVGECRDGMSGDDVKWWKIVETGCVQVNGRYQIPLPLRDNGIVIPYSKGHAYKRALNTRKKLLGDRELLNMYCTSMREMIVKGYAEQVPAHNRKRGNTWYIPHFAVTHKDKPGKVRVVFDCAARTSGVCLNDLLITGPTLGNDLLDVLMRFRLGRHACTADIEAMYYQVQVPEEHRDYLRYFWWRDIFDEHSIEEYRMRVHLFGANSSPSVATYALRRVADTATGYSEEARGAIRRNFYVDDCLLPVLDGKHMERLLKEVCELCSEAGFKLGKIHGTCACEMVSGGSTTEPIQKALGVWWDRSIDKLSPCIPEETVPETRRKLLSSIASVYDPLGLIAPALLRGRLILQDTFRLRELGWDDPLEDECRRLSSEWAASLQIMRGVGVARGISVDEVTNWQLHVFSDASQEGHGAVAYVRVETNSGTYCSFIWGRARVNPVKSISIPRLELVAALLAARMRVRIEENFSVKFDMVCMWTDSMVVLKYLQNETDRFKIFVANRVTLIKEVTSVDEWRYVDSKSNPADDASRAFQTSRWVSGPEFLLKEMNVWPRERVVLSDSEECELERRRVTVNVMPVSENWLDKMSARYSDWQRLRRAVAWLAVFCRWLKSKRVDVSRPSRSDLMNSELCLVKQAQQQVYSKELQLLESGRKLGRDSPLRKLDVILVDGLLRVGGRLGRADVCDAEKHPMILPSRCAVVDLIVRDSHYRLGHLGAATVLADVRSKYWIIKGHSTVRRILSGCVVCRKVQGKVCEQKMADLPAERVVASRHPFQFTGLDCFGPFMVKHGRRTEKRYGVLFTCLTMRAVHLEVAADMSTDGICNAIRRFLARRGRVQKFVSDNGTNFVGARREMLSALSSDEVRGRFGYKGIDWSFNPPSASHFGGVWERLIRIVRRVFEAVVGKQCMTIDGLSTVFCEAEVAINSRPLSIVSSDHRDPKAISPIMLLTMNDAAEVWGNFDADTCYSRRRWRHVQHVSDQFWRRWVKEYRAVLQERRKWGKERRNISSGDVVLLVDETQPRCHWPLGVVQGSKAGRDGLVRSVEVRHNSRVYRRPVSKLVLLLGDGDLM